MPRATVRKAWQITLPADVRDSLRIDEGDEVEFETVADGVVQIRGLKLIPADQAWFWTQTWQAGEREASEDIRLGRTTTVETLDDMFQELDH
ncbi:MAG TPA: AbrB/MazE/SpoVT family DNA-binding domain-containing protein [Jiangellaceae bacterium]